MSNFNYFFFYVSFVRLGFSSVFVGFYGFLRLISIDRQRVRGVFSSIFFFFFLLKTSVTFADSFGVLFPMKKKEKFYDRKVRSTVYSFVNIKRCSQSETKRPLRRLRRKRAVLFPFSGGQSRVISAKRKKSIGISSSGRCSRRKRALLNNSVRRSGRLKKKK